VNRQIAVMKAIVKRVEALEAAVANDLHAVVTFEDGEKRRLSVPDVALAAFHGKVVHIQWLGKDNGEHGMLPQLAEALKCRGA